MDTKALFDKLSAYGADIEGALNRFMQDESLYETCLKMYMEDTNFEALGAAIEEKAYDKAFEAAHALKGVAGNLGLTPLYKSICSLVEPLRVNDHSNAEALYADIKQLQDAYCVIMAGHEGDAAGPDASESSTTPKETD